MSDKVKLLIQKYKHSDGRLQNATPHVIGAVIKRDGLRALDSAEFIVPSETPVSEGQVVKWIQDDADTTYLRSCYLFQGSKRDEAGWEADGTPDTYSSGSTEVSKFRHGTSGKFKGILHMEGANNVNYVVIPNKTMFTNNSVSGGDREINIHDFDGNFDIFIWISCGNSPVGHLLFKGASANGQRLEISATASGSDYLINVAFEDGDGTQQLLTSSTGSKYLKVDAVNLVRVRRIGSIFSLWVINGTESSNTLFDTPDAEATNTNVGNITSSSNNTYIGSNGSGSNIYSNTGESEWIQSVRIYCGGTLDLLDARALFKARAQPLVMKFAGTIWKINDTTNGKKIYANGFGKILTKTDLNTQILDDGTSDQYTPVNGGNSNNTLNRTLNVYKDEPISNIIYSILKMLNTANASMTNNAKDFSNFEMHLAKSVGGDELDEFTAEGNLLQVIKILIIHGTGGNLHFYISPRGVCLIEDLGIDRGITFQHNPYNMQENGADDTFTANDITINGRIPIKTSVLPLVNQGINTNIDISSKIGNSIPIAVRIYDTFNSGVDSITVGKGGTVSGAPLITLTGGRPNSTSSQIAEAAISDYDGNAINTVEVEERGNDYISIPTVTLSGSHTTDPVLTATISGGEWLENDSSNNKGDFTIDREGKTINIKHWNDGATSGTHNIEVHIDHEDIQVSGSNLNVKRYLGTSSINSIGRYKKTFNVPQFTGSPIGMALFANHLGGLLENINKRYTVKAPFLVNFIRENHKVTIKNSIKGINAANQIIKSIHWHYPKNMTVIEVGEHLASAYDLVVGSNEAIHALKSQSLKSMNREL